MRLWSGHTVRGALEIHNTIQYNTIQLIIWLWLCIHTHKDLRQSVQARLLYMNMYWHNWVNNWVTPRRDWQSSPTGFYTYIHSSDWFKSAGCMMILWLACRTINQEIGGSNPTRVEICFEISAPPAPLTDSAITSTLSAGRSDGEGEDWHLYAKAKKHLLVNASCP